MTEPRPLLSDTTRRLLAIDAETLDRLLDEGRTLRKEFETRTRGMRLLTAADLGRRCR